MKSELTMDSMMCWPPYLTTLQVPQVLARNQAGLDRRLMFTTSNGIFLTSRARIVRSAKGQNLTGSSTGNIVIVSVPHIVGVHVDPVVPVAHLLSRSVSVLSRLFPEMSTWWMSPGRSSH